MLQNRVTQVNTFDWSIQKWPTTLKFENYFGAGEQKVKKAKFKSTDSFVNFRKIFPYQRMKIDLKPTKW